MPSRIKLRPHRDGTRPRDPYRNIAHNPSNAWNFSPKRVEGYDEIMRQREKERRAPKDRQFPHGKAVVTGRLPYRDRNQRYPLEAILEAKISGRNPQRRT